MNASDLVIVWATYGYNDPAIKAWSAAICPTCAQTMRVSDDNKLVMHMRAVDAKYEDDALCPGGGTQPERTTMERSAGQWQIIARATGRSLGYFAELADARSKLAEMQKTVKGDVTPPGREAQVRALKEKPGIDNPWAVAWASYEKGDATYDGAKCDDCGQMVPVVDAKYVDHVAPGGSYGEPTMSATNMDAKMSMCDGSGAMCKYDTIEQRGGKWVLLSKSTGKVLGTHPTKEAAEAQERAVQASKHADATTVKRWERIDFAPGELPTARVTADGFLQVAGRVARTGIQEYRDGQGGTRRELRLPEEVRKSLPSFPLQPMTNLHPAEMVTPDNAQKYAVGAVGPAELKSDGWVLAPLSIWRADAIEAARNGRVQLSVGYTCRLETQDGEWQGQKYDAVQRDIVVNHVALVDAARAGADARLRLDAGDAEAVFARDTRENVSSIRGANMAKLTIDGMVFEVQDANAQAALDGFVARVQKDRDEKVAAEKLRADNAEKLRDGAVKERDAAQGRLDARNAEDKQPIKLDGQEISAADAVDPAKFAAFVQPIVDARAQARAALLVEARKHLGANEKFDAHTAKDGKPVAARTDSEIKRMVVIKLDPSAKLDGKSDDYVQARYDAVIEAAAKRQPQAIDLARATGGPAPIPQLAGERADEGGEADAEAARKAMIDRMLRANPKHPKHDAALASKA
jgi:uncharacterized protein